MEGRWKATWKRKVKLPWREAGSHNHHDDVVDSEHYIVNKELFLPHTTRKVTRGLPDTPRATRGLPSSQKKVMRGLQHTIRVARCLPSATRVTSGLPRLPRHATKGRMSITRIRKSLPHNQKGHDRSPVNPPSRQPRGKY